MRLVWLVLLSTAACGIAHAEDELHTEAHRYAEEGQALADRFELRGAISAYRKAWQASPDPFYLYNIGYLSMRVSEMEAPADALRDKHIAVDHLRRYLATRPAARERGMVTQWIAGLEAKIPPLEEQQRRAEMERTATEEARASAIRAQSALAERLRRLEADLLRVEADKQRADAESRRLQAAANQRAARLRIGLAMVGAGLALAAAGGAMIGAGAVEGATRAASMSGFTPAFGDRLATLNALGGMALGAGGAILAGGFAFTLTASNSVVGSLSATSTGGTVSLSGSF